MVATPKNVWRCKRRIQPSNGCAATLRPTVRTEPPGVDSRHPSTPLRGYAEAGGSNEGRKEKSLRPFPFEGRFGFKRHAQPPTAANSAPVTNSCYQYEHDADCVAEDDPSSTEGYAEDEDAAEEQ